MFKTGKYTKEQHFLPRMYLKRFSYDGVHCYTLNDSNTIHCQSTKDICKKRNLYELTNQKGEVIHRNLFEKKLFGEAEREFSPFFDEMLEVLRKRESVVDFLAKDDNRLCLIWFASSLFLRNELTIAQTQSTGAEIGIYWTPQQAKNNGILHNASLSKYLSDKWAEEFNIIVHANWTEEPFITADFPFCMLPPITQSWRFWYFPVALQCLLILEPRQLTGLQMDTEVNSSIEFVQSINQLFGLHKDVLLISNDKGVLEKLRKWRL